MDQLPPPSDTTGLLTAMFGGAVAAVVQTTFTYPLEYFKTIAQIENKKIIVKECIVPYDSMKPLFTGCLPLSIGMALKSSSRMFLFSGFSSLMAQDDGKTNAPRIVVAGMMTGVLESFWAIPFENIKVRMIENSMIRFGLRTTLDEEASSSNRKYSNNTDSKKNGKIRLSNRPKSSNSFAELHPRIKAIQYYHENPSSTFRGILKEMYATGGIMSFTRGSTITLARQALNSMVWYSTYSSFQQMIDPSRDSITELELLGMGFASSAAVVLITQPIDLLKTRMQTKDYRILYKDVMSCTASVFFNEGIKKFWAGAVPRFVKVSCSSTVSLMTYEYVTKSVNKLSDIKPFAA